MHVNAHRSATEKGFLYIFYVCDTFVATYDIRYYRPEEGMLWKDQIEKAYINATN